MSNAATLSNYDYFYSVTALTGTASALGFTVNGGDLQATAKGGLAIVDNAFFSHAIADYTLSANFEMDSYDGGQGIFGLAFRTGDQGAFYCFQWSGKFGNGNGGVPDWEIEKNSGYTTGGVSWVWLATGAVTPTYIPGTWVELSVVVNGNHFMAYANFNDGAGNQLIYDVTDSSGTPYTSGGAGIRSYALSDNIVRTSDLSISFTCSPTVTPTCTPDPSAGPSGTPTGTASPTATPPGLDPTATAVPAAATATPLPFILTPHYPNPDPAGPSGVWIPYSINRDARVDVTVFDVAGETVRTWAATETPAGDHEQFWDTRNGAGHPAASGVYFVRIHSSANGDNGRVAWEKLALTR